MKKNIKNQLLYFLYSLISLAGLMLLFYGRGMNIKNATNSVIYFVVFYIFYNYIKNFHFPDKRTTIFAAIFSLILSYAVVVGNQLDIYCNSIPEWAVVINTFLLGIMFTPFFTQILKLRIKNKDQNDESSNTSTKSSFKKVLITFLIIWFFGFLGWLALYPGGYDYDAPLQLNQFINTEIAPTTHYSVLFSFIQYKVVSLGFNIFGNYQAAIGLFTLLQMTIVAGVTTYISTFISNHCKIKWVLPLLIAFFSLFPFHILLQVSCVQDTLFACCTALFAISLYKIIIEDANIKSIKNILMFLIAGLLLCMFRNNGIYALIFVLVFTILLKIIAKIDLNIKKFSLLLIIIIITNSLYTKLLLPALGVEKGDSIQEMCSIPSQQIARVVYENPDILTDEEKESIKNFYPECNFDMYNDYPLVADGIKDYLDEDYYYSHKKEYRDLYISLGLKDPKDYYLAFLCNSLGLWYTDKNYYDYRMFHPYIEYKISTPHDFSEDLIQVERNSKFPIYEKLLAIILDNGYWQVFPFISNACSIGTYSFIMLYIIMLSIYKKKIEFIIPLTILLGIWLTLFLGPVIIYRYIYFIVLSMPLLLLIIRDLLKESS